MTQRLYRQKGHGLSAKIRLEAGSPQTTEVIEGGLPRLRRRLQGPTDDDGVVRWS